MVWLYFRGSPSQHDPPQHSLTGNGRANQHNLTCLHLHGQKHGWKKLSMCMGQLSLHKSYRDRKAMREVYLGEDTQGLC